MGNRANAKLIRIMLKRAAAASADDYAGPHGELLVVSGDSKRLHVNNLNKGGVAIPLTPSVAATPFITAPIDGASGTSLTPVIQSSMYQGTESHQSTHWEVSRDGSFTDIVVDTGWDTRSLTELQVGDIMPLDNGVTYYVRCRHRNNAGAITGWSPANSFTTDSMATPPTIETGSWAGVTDLDDGDVSVQSPAIRVARDTEVMVLCDVWGDEARADNSMPVGWVLYKRDGVWMESKLSIRGSAVAGAVAISGQVTSDGSVIVMQVWRSAESDTCYLVFERDGDEWPLAAALVPDQTVDAVINGYVHFDRFALTRDQLVVGLSATYSDPSNAPAPPTMNLLIYNKDVDGWVESLSQSLPMPSAVPGPILSRDIRMNDDGAWIFISNPHQSYAEDTRNTVDVQYPVGSIHCYWYNGTALTKSAELRASNATYSRVDTTDSMALGWTFDISADGQTLVALDGMGGLYKWLKNSGSWTLADEIFSPESPHVLLWSASSTLMGDFSFQSYWWNAGCDEALSLTADGSVALVYSALRGGVVDGAVQLDLANMPSVIRLFDPQNDTYPLAGTSPAAKGNLTQLYGGSTAQTLSLITPDTGVVVAHYILYR